MRILIFATNYLPNIGGAEIAVKEITSRLPDIEFTLLAPRYTRSVPKRERIGNVDVHRVGFGFALDKFFIDLMLFRALMLHRKAAYDATWSLMASQASVGAAVFKKFHTDIPLILTLQEGDEEEHLKRYVLGSNVLYKLFIKPWHLLVFKYADYVTVISNYLADRAEQNGVPRERITLIPNGVDVAAFQAPVSESEKEKIQKELDIQENDRVLFTASRLVKKNGLEDLIESMKDLPKDTKLIIAGEGALREQLESQAEKSGLKERVHFLGSVSHDALPSYLAIADVFIRPSLSEGMGNSFIEAMAAGVPIVGTSVGGIPDFLEHEKTGLFCEVNNPESIAEQVKRLFKESDLRKRIVEDAEKLATERYSWDTIAQMMKEEIFDKVDTP